MNVFKRPVFVSLVGGIVLSNAAVAYFVGSWHTLGPALLVLAFLFQSVLGLLTNIIAAPFSAHLDSLMRGAQPAPDAPAGVGGETHLRSERVYSGIEVALRLAVVNIFTFLLINISLETAVVYFRSLERNHQLQFTDAGFLQMQVFMAGWLIWTLWLPFFTGISIGIGRRVQKLNFWACSLGVAVSIPFYLLLTRAIGLSTGFGKSEQFPAQVVGGSPVVLTIFVQIVWTISIWFVMSLYAFGIAAFTRVSALVSARIAQAVQPLRMRLSTMSEGIIPSFLLKKKPEQHQ